MWFIKMKVVLGLFILVLIFDDVILDLLPLT